MQRSPGNSIVVPTVPDLRRISNWGPVGWGMAAGQGGSLSTLQSSPPPQYKAQAANLLQQKTADPQTTNFTHSQTDVRDISHSPQLFIFFRNKRGRSDHSLH